MTIVILILFTLFVFFDLFLLRKQNEDLFVRIMTFPKWFWPLYVALIVVIMAASEKWEEFSSFLVVFISPLYIYKRLRFKHAMSSHAWALPPPLGRNLYLASDAFGVVLAWMIGMMAVTFLAKGVSFLFPMLESQLGELVFITACSYILMIVLIYRLTLKYSNIPFFEIIGLKRNHQSFWNLVVWPALLGLAFAALSSTLILTRTHQPSTPIGEVLESTTSSWIFVAFLGMAVLMAPFFEEIIFRGFFFYAISKYRGRVVAILVVGSLFGLMHFEQYWGDWTAIIMVTILGFILTLLRAFTGSSLSSIVTHYVFNGAMTIIPIIMMLLSNPAYFEYQMRFVQLDVTAKERLLSESIRDFPEHAPSYNDLAWLYVEEEKNLEEALRLVERALTLDPEPYAFWDTKAEVLYKMGRVKEAVAIGQDLVEQYPSIPHAKKQLQKFQEALE